MAYNETTTKEIAMDNDKIIPDASSLTKMDMIRAALGWTVIAAIGVVCYKAGKKAGVEQTTEQ